mgnify:CR=1 FL=1
MPDAVLQAMHRAAPNIYEGAMVEMVAALAPDLKRVARTRHNLAMYVCNGHGVWEAAHTNFLSRGDHVLAGSLDKPHGLRECFIVDPEGYVWVPSTQIRG